MFTLIKPDTHIDFISKAGIFSALSILVVIGCLVGIFTKGFNFGIDFTGGTVVQVKFAEPKTAEDVRTLVNEIGQSNASVIALGEEKREYMITIPPVEDESKIIPLAERIVGKVGKDHVEIEKVDVVGPKVGQDLKWAALKSLFYSIILITIYIWFRFDFRFAPGATIALVHDLIIIAGFYVFSGREFTIASVAALLTVAGYSVNDTIIIYDRVRELFKLGGAGLPLKPTLNKAINQTLSRTIITSLTTLISVMGFVYFTEGDIENFALALAIGIVVGTYSTVYVASSATLLFARMAESKAGAK
ncbi:MAG: protein translocase subunit SecF [Bdellovibrionota bacterium]